MMISICLCTTHVNNAHVNEKLRHVLRQNVKFCTIDVPANIKIGLAKLKFM